MTPTPDAVEREIKLRADDLEALRGRLRALGAHRLQSEDFESNTLFDWPPTQASNLQAQGKVLRLREDGQGVRLTFKGRLKLEGEVRVRAEQEIHVDDGGAARALLQGLGLQPVRRYEKYRETWILEGNEVVLDRTPLGSFVEIELRSGGDVVQAARDLGLDPERAERRSYLELWDERRRVAPETPCDMVFSSLALPADEDG
jgi:adenylate cyclase class 2